MDEKRFAEENPLVLAFVGDAVWTLYVREAIAGRGKVGELHQIANGYICAAAQSKIFQKIFEEFSEEEKDIANRARNARNNTVPKNCTLSEYKLATAFEAVIGFNYLAQNKDRLEQILKKAF